MLDLSRIRRAWEFGRHIPPAKLLRRGQLMARFRSRDRRGPFLPPLVEAELASDLPHPIFPPRKTGKIKVDTSGLHVCFLGRCLSFPENKIDWTAPGPGTDTQLWRMNLHYMEYLEEVNDALFSDLVGQWIASNGIVQPGAWRDGWNAYALSTRVVVWLQQLAARGNGVSPDTVAIIENSLIRQLGYLEQHLETDIGGNHLIKNIKALLWAGRAFDGAGAQRWQTLGRKLLLQEVVLQILPDGVHYERSPSYHAQVFADLLECRAVLSGRSPELDQALAKMAQVTADLTHPDGFAAQFNDAGLTMAYSPGECLDAFEVQVGFRPSPQRCFAYRTAGYFGYRDDRLALIADCGPVAPDDLPAHGQGDILSFELSVDGKRLIVDQGVFEYIPGKKRTRSKSAAAHNTLWIEEVEQAEFYGSFRCGRRPKVQLRLWDESDRGMVLEGSHDGYSRAIGAPRHIRKIEMSPEGLRILDLVEAKQDVVASIGILLHPDVEIVPLEAGGFLLHLPNGPEMQFSCSASVRAQTAVWWPDMGCELLTTRLVAHVASACLATETTITFAEAA